MNKIDFTIRVFLCLLLLASCTPRTTPAPEVELDEIFYSNPQRQGDATQAHEQLRVPEASLISLNLVEESTKLKWLQSQARFRHWPGL